MHPPVCRTLLCTGAVPYVLVVLQISPALRLRGSFSVRACPAAHPVDLGGGRRKRGRGRRRRGEEEEGGEGEGGRRGEGEGGEGEEVREGGEEKVRGEVKGVGG